MLQVVGTQARNLRKFSSKFLHSCVDEQCPSNMTSTRNIIYEKLARKLAKVYCPCCH